MRTKIIDGIEINTVAIAGRALHFLMNRSEDALFKRECQNMINLLFEKFPTAMPKPEKESLAE